MYSLKEKSVRWFDRTLKSVRKFERTQR